MAEIKAFLVPVVIDSTTERDPAIPEKFRELQWTRLPAGETPPAFVERVRRLLSPTSPAHSANGTSSSGTDAIRDRATNAAYAGPRWLRPVLLVAALIAFGAGAYVAIDRFNMAKRSAPASTAIADKSIAVLPFVDLSERHDQEYFADGMAEEILNLLVKIPDLKVIGHTSSFPIQGKDRRSAQDRRYARRDLCAGR